MVCASVNSKVLQSIKIVNFKVSVGLYVNFVFIYNNCLSTGCPKSHCTTVRAYCSACDHLICKISSGMFQESSSFEEFNGFSEINVHFLNERSFFTFFAPLT